jgi:hypothetical protein
MEWHIFVARTGFRVEVNVPNLLMFTEENAVDLHYVGRFVVTVGGGENI